MFLRKRVRSLLRTTFSASNSTEQDEENEGLNSLIRSSNEKLEENQFLDGTAIYERILNGKNARKKAEMPEVYSGKTGLDLPVISLGRIGNEIRACYTGPDGGLTKVKLFKI